MTWSVALVLWYVTLAVLLYQLWAYRSPLAGLTLCYWLDLASHHLITETFCLLHVNHSTYRWAADLGFPITGYAMLGLLTGGAILPWLFPQLSNDRPYVAARPSPGPDASLGAAALAIPVGTAAFLVGAVPQIPSLSAILFGGNMLAGAGFAWLVVRYSRAGRRTTAGWVMLSALALPVLTMTVKGFLGYGIMSLMVMVSVVTAAARARARSIIKWSAAAAVAAYLTLSVFTTYMSGRDLIRQSVWGRRDTLGERLTVVAKVFADRWSWFDPWDEDHRYILDMRLNQNYFVGHNKALLDRGDMRHLHGATLEEGLLVMVPRVIWPGKPAVSGGSEQMAAMTGLEFARGVTFGLGHVLEFHANYGRGGVFFGFLAFGAMIAYIDRRAGRHLAAGRLREFLLWFLPGTALVNGALGRFTETTTAFLGFWALAAGYGFLASALYLPAAAGPRGLGRLSQLMRARVAAYGRDPQARPGPAARPPAPARESEVPPPAQPIASSGAGTR